MTFFERFPLEIVLQIISYALYKHAKPSEILIVSKLFHHMGLSLLHAHVRLRNPRMAEGYFSSTSVANSPWLAQTIHYEMPPEVWYKDVCWAMHVGLDKVISMAGRARGGPSAATLEIPMILDELVICVHANSFTWDNCVIYNALSRVNPIRFSWYIETPEEQGYRHPAHNDIFSAIGPEPMYYLAHAMSKWTRLVHLTLSGVDLTHYGVNIHRLLGNPNLYPAQERFDLHHSIQHSPHIRHWTATESDLPLFRSGISTLKTVRIMRSIHVEPREIVRMLSLPGFDALERVSLEEVYDGITYKEPSIPTVTCIKMEDLEHAVEIVDNRAQEAEYLYQRVRDVVVCKEVWTEREQRVRALLEGLVVN